ncbi:MAG: hypothetical protein QNJ65_22865 [Xenococcaceae cyanobacterium MO_234.B1]|nr:hypothetical protein [Xenococcaceae cyanobacterium MO_234.B1]
MRIEHLISINGAILVVYYTSSNCYQYEIVFWDGSSYQPNELYKNADQALAVGIESIRIVIGYQ